MSSKLRNGGDQHKRPQRTNGLSVQEYLTVVVVVVVVVDVEDFQDELRRMCVQNDEAINK